MATAMTVANPTVLLPGFGGAITVSLSNTQTSARIDLSMVGMFAAVLTSEVGTNSTQLQQSFDGTNWANLGSALAAAGDTGKYDITDGPFGFIRVVQTGSGSGVVTIVGWPIPVRQ